MALSYGCSFGGTLHAPFQVNWRPVLLFAKGRFLRKTVQVFSDVFTVGRQPKSHHPWEQPLEPFVYWLGRLTNPGQLVCDTHAGSGTIGVACKQIGRRYLGTEIDPGHARTARRRIAEARPEQQRSGSPA
jgi:DNA modification methylase